MTQVDSQTPGRAFRLPQGAVAWALGGILLLAAVLRVYNIADNPRGFFADEASFGYNAYTILTSGTDEHGERFPLLFRAFGEYKLPVYTYGIVPFVAVLGLTEAAVRLAAAAFGIATVLVVYFLGRELFRSQAAGLLAALILAVEPWHVHYSRTGLGDIAAYPLFLTLGLFLFLRGRERPIPWWPTAAVAWGVAFYAYRGGWIFLPPLLALLALLYGRDLLRHWGPALLSAALFALLLAPLGQHLVGGAGDRIQQVAVLGAEERHGRSPLETYAAYFGPSFLFQQGDNGYLLRHFLPGQGQLYWLQAPFLLAGLAALVWRPRREGVLLLAAFALYPVGGVLTDANPISSRTIHGAILFALLTAEGMRATGSILRRLPKGWGRWAVAGLAGVVAGVGVLQAGAYLQRYHGEYPALSAGYWGWQWGPEEIVPIFVSLQDRYDDLVLDGDFNAPYIFFRFYAPEGCDKCRIGNSDRYDPKRRQLFALRPENVKDSYQYRVLRTLYYPDGQVAFLVGEIAGRQAP